MRALLLSSAAACIPLPIAHMEEVTPSVYGVIRWSDGAPVGGAQVATTGGRRDRRCRGPGGRATTHRDGSFLIPGASVHRRVLWITLIENFGLTPYWLCLRVSDTLSANSVGTATMRVYLRRHYGGDALSLVSWIWKDTIWMTPAAQVAEGGAWRIAGDTGYYRLLAAGIDDFGREGRAWVQWVQHAPGNTLSIRSTAELVTDIPVDMSAGAQIDWAGSDWIAIVHVNGRRPGRFNRTFQLGEPGVVRPSVE